MLDGGIHIEPLRCRLLSRHNDVDIVPAPQAVIGYREKSVGIGRKVYPDHICLLIHHVVDKTRVLVAESVMVLPPDVGCEQVVEGGDGTPPRDFLLGYLEPLGVLVEHGVDNVDKCLVAGEETVPTREEIPFQPTLTGMFAEDLHHPPIWGKVVIIGNRFSHPRFVRHLE